MRISCKATSVLLLAAFWAAIGTSCGGGGLTKGQARSIGNFKVLNSNMSNSDIWALNRPILLTFNNAVDPSSISFTSIIIRPVSPPVQGNPVTGTFEIVPGTDGKSIAFYPTCPTVPTNDNGAFVPGGWNYELILPTEGTFGSSVLRDSSGTQLTTGLQRSFFSPIDGIDPLFIDTVTGPPVLVQNTEFPKFPTGLNLQSMESDPVEIRFNQPVNGDPTNLNTDRLFLLYEDAIGSNTFSPTNKVPGEWLLVENCSRDGAIVHFLIEGVLPPNRLIKLVVTTDFEDLAENVNVVVQEIVFATPSLASLYGDPTILDTDETVDEYVEAFSHPLDLDFDAPSPSPFMEVNDGEAKASFAYPGNEVPADEDFILSNNLFVEVLTDGTQEISDSTGREFTFVNGVLHVDDFTIQAGSTLRARGSNPLIIYASGMVDIQGGLDVSGTNAQTPNALNAPHIIEIGAEGQCGGGKGGNASQETEIETLRAETGDGPFGLAGFGGQGGEGAVQTIWAIPEDENFGADSANDDPRDLAIRQLIAGGGAGGTFSRGVNESVQWDRWTGESVPLSFDNTGPDYRASRHSALVLENFDPFKGGEDGMRGSSWDSGRPEPIPAFMPWANGCFGMEEVAIDTAADDSNDGFDPAWTTGGDPAFSYGTPSLGPDPGFSNPSPLIGTLDDDFWGRRYDPISDTIIFGELLAPWAGYGGGGSGDTSIVVRLDLDLDMLLDAITNFFPDATFPIGTTFEYMKGAAAGGGGGQLLIMAVGPIVLGPTTVIKANGGNGAAGEPYWLTGSSISGSGAGSGGHIVLQSATGLDVSTIDVGTDPINNPPAVNPELVQAFGGRRGWAGSTLITDLPGAPNGYDGNGDFMVGRGGAGGNGIIQIHVPNAATDIVWHPDSENAIINHIGNPADPVRVEEIFALYSAPTAFSLVPFFGPESRVQSRWIDTGLADQHTVAGGSSPSYPDFDNALLSFEGATNGLLNANGGLVTKLTSVAAGPTATAIFSPHEVTISAISGITQPLAAEFTRNPNLLIGYDLYPDSSAPEGDGNSYEIVAAEYNAVLDNMTVYTRVVDGAMTSALNPGNPNWDIRKKFIRVNTDGQKDRLVDAASVRFEFQGAEESAPGSNEPGTPTLWSDDLSILDGQRFFRYRIIVDIDAQENGVTLDNEKPGVDYFKFPFVW